MLEVVRLHPEAVYRMGAERPARPGRSRTKLGGLHVDELALGERLRYRNSVSFEAIDMERNRLTNEVDNLVASDSGSHAARKIGHMRPPARLSALDHHHVSRHFPASPPVETGLLEDRAQGARRSVETRSLRRLPSAPV